MFDISKMYLDGTVIEDDSYLDFEKCTVEFSDYHRNSVLSWSIYSDDYDTPQTGYSIQFEEYDSENVLLDSGFINSEEQSYYFDTKALYEFKRIVVRLTVWIGEDEETDTRTLINGALSDTSGDWITSQNDEGNNELVLFKDFELDEDATEAYIYSCGIGYQKVFFDKLNCSCGFLNPSHSNYSKTCYYSALRLNSVKAGNHRIRIHIAPGWRNNSSEFLKEVLPDPTFHGPAQLWARIELVLEDGSKKVITTGKGWKYVLGPRESHIYDGEIFHAERNYEQINTYIARPVKVVPGPGGVLRPDILPDIKCNKIYKPVEITNPVPGKYVVDFGQNLAGVACLEFPWIQFKEGKEIKLEFAEELEEDGTVYMAPLRGAKQTDIYICAGDSRDIYCWIPDYTYHGFRYCQVSGIERLKKDSIKALAIYNSADKNTSFSCGNALLNQIHKNAVMTERSNLHSILTDCPQRDERMGWLNDATVRFEETPYNFDVSRLFPKVMQDINDEQNADGAYACCAPRYFGSVPADPVCSSYLVAAKQSYLHCGDTYPIIKFFDSMAAWEDYLYTQKSDDGIVNYSYYGDWAGPVYACEGDENPRSAVTPGILMSTGYSYWNCVTLSEFAHILGREADEVKYSERASYIQKAFLAKWFNKETCKVAGGSMGAQAFALWLNIIPEEYRAQAARVMRDDLVWRNYNFTTGNLTSRYIADMLCEYGYVDDAYKMLTKETYPSFGFMIQHEATTVWERFELKKNPGMNSHNHPMYGSIDSWFFRYLCGVQPVEPGFRRVRIKPYIPTDLMSAHCVVDTIMGDISVRWSKRYGRTYLFIQLPFGVTADVEFGDLRESGVRGFAKFELNE